MVLVTHIVMLKLFLNMRSLQGAQLPDSEYESLLYIHEQIIDHKIVTVDHLSQLTDLVGLETAEQFRELARSKNYLSTDRKIKIVIQI